MKPSKDLDEQTREILDEYMPDGWNGNMLEELEEFIEQREREARLNEVQNAYEHWINGRKFISSYFRGRIADLSQALKEHKEAEL